MWKQVLVMMVFITAPLFSQGLFDSAVEKEKLSDTRLEINGYFRGVLFGGLEPGSDDLEMKSAYGELGLKLRARAGSWGDGFAEMRFRRGSEFDVPVSEWNLREGYVNGYFGPFDIRAGHQIVVWGRADGLNPTDNITPKNMLARSPDEDDKRNANFVLRSHLNLNPVRIEAVWVPVFAMSVVPMGLIPLPLGIEMDDPLLPDMDFRNSTYALKAELLLPSFDASISYFNGYNPFPGIDATTPVFDGSPLTISAYPRAYRMQVWGAYFSTTLGTFGFRSEAAYKRPFGDIQANAYLPNPDLQLILGLDTQKGDFSLILQYLGRYVFDFGELLLGETPESFVLFELGTRNRLLSGQQNEFSHGLSARPALSLFHETMTLELLGLYYFTTEELMLRPKVTWDIADAWTVTAGAEVYYGSDGTLYGLVDRTLSSLFCELRISF